MRIIDRYISTRFLIPFVYCLSGFSMIFVIGDLFENLDDFLESSGWFLVALRYYLLFLPSIFGYITAVAVLLALLSSLSVLKKYNEISAMRSAGISVYRIAAPLLLLTLVIALAVFYINEEVVPDAYRESQELKKQHQGTDYQKILTNVTHLNRVTSQAFHFKRFWPGDNTGQGVSIHDLRTDGTPYRRISALEAQWLDGSWWLYDGIICSQPLDDTPIKQEFSKRSFDFELHPLDLLQSNEELPFRGFFELRETLERRTGYPEVLLRPLRVEFHQKLALPVSCLIMGLLGVTFGLRTSRGGVMAGVGISLVLSFLYYVFYSITGAMGNQAYLAPWLAAWAANIVFGGIGLWLFLRLN